MKQRMHLLVLALVLIAVTFMSPQNQDAVSAAETLLITKELRQAVQEFGEIPIIIGLDTPVYSSLSAIDATIGNLNQAGLDTLTQEIADVSDGVLNRLAGQQINQVKRYDYFPLMAMIIDEAALEALAADKSVTQISLDALVAPAMDDTLPLIQANNSHFLNYTGSGWSIAILDTGVDKSHPALFGKVASEACYSSNVPSHGASSLCPGGATSSVATGSAVACPVGVSGCEHGTLVAGVAARVAPSAWLVPIQVFSRVTDSGSNTLCRDANRTSPCTLSYTSDQVAALNRVFALHINTNSINFASVNMSLGGGSSPLICDQESDLFSLLLAINQLRGQNIATVAGSGNNGYRNAMNSPACLSPVISVASSSKSDQIAATSNISPQTTLFAPGQSILAPVPQANTPIYQTKSGTSLAAPHVAGAIATFKEARPTATVPQIITALTGSGPTITDQRSGGFITKRRLNTWTAVCNLISCDGDDFRTLGANQTLNGTISPAGDVDHYYYFGTAGQRLTLRMNRTSGSMDPYLELFTGSGIRVALNDNGGGGVNALINGYFLPQNGLYQIRARSVNNFTGNYQISASTQVEQLNPVPQITYLSPSSATGTFFGSDFWVAIYGSNFMPDSQVRWNGQLRAKFYSSPTLIYIRVLGGDIGFPWPRNAFVTVVNPTPGGGTSNSRVFTIKDPFLGESSLLSPASGSSVSVGDKQAFEISWEAPIDTGTWRDMQYMDMRLRNEQGETAAWVRVVEQPGDGSFYRLLNGAEELVDEGLPGEDRDLVLENIVTLHLAESSFSGSGLTAVMTPTLTFGPAAVGTYNVEFRVDSKSGEDDELNVQDTDVLGVFSVLPAGCEVAISDVTIGGADAGTINTPLIFTTGVSPINASSPFSYTWTPEPQAGQGLPTATYSFGEPGEHLISVQVENCGAFAADIYPILVSTGPDRDLTITKEAPAAAIANQPFTYTLTITNNGANSAANLDVYDILPSGATYIDGGALVGNQVEWQISALAGYGESVAVTFQVSAAGDLVNDHYGVYAAGGFSAQTSTPVLTRIVHADVLLTPLAEGQLIYNESSLSSLLTFPEGAVFADTLVTYRETGAPPDLGDLPFAGRAFRLDAYQGNNPVDDFRIYETVQVELKYDSSAVAGLNPDNLTLYYWQNGHWQRSGVECTTNSAQQLVQCSLSNPLMSRYVLVEGSHKLFIPLIGNNLNTIGE
jgi:uncharacterized repeat protein (TIGR01451 family)